MKSYNENLHSNLPMTNSELSKTVSKALKQAENGEVQKLDVVFKALLKDL